MKTKDEVPFRWSKKDAIQLESIVNKDPHDWPPEHVQVVRKINSIWEEMAKTIDFDFSDDSVIDTIPEYFSDQSKRSIFDLFDDAKEATDFFNDFRTVRARRALYQLQYTAQEYSSAIQDLIRFFLNIVEASPVAFRDDPPLRLEAVLICIYNAIFMKGITYDILMQILQIIQALDAYQSKYKNIEEKKQQGLKRSAGKQDAVQWRATIFDEFDKYFNLQKTNNPKLSKHQAVNSFFKTKTGDERFSQCWRDPETFYKSICSRKQSSTKNKAREAKWQEEIAPYKIPQTILDIVANWQDDN